jgi:hypothetical protein
MALSNWGGTHVSSHASSLFIGASGRCSNNTRVLSFALCRIFTRSEILPKLLLLKN